MPSDPLTPEARARLEKEIANNECAAHMEYIVFSGCEPYVARFNEGDRSDKVMRRLRVSNEARDNCRRFCQLALDLRALLASHDALGARIGEYSRLFWRSVGCHLSHDATVTVDFESYTDAKAFYKLLTEQDLSPQPPTPEGKEA